MRDIHQKLSFMLGPIARRQSYRVFLLVVVMAAVEALGVASIMPFVAVLSNPSVVDTNPYLLWFNEHLGFSSTDSFLLFLGVATFVLLISSIAVRALTLWVQLKFSNYQIHAVGTRLVSHYLRQPYEWFVSRRTSDLGVNVLAEVTNVIQGVLTQYMFFVANIVVALLLFALLLVVDPILATLVWLVLGGAYAVVFVLVHRFLRRIGEGRIYANRGRFNVLQEAFSGIKDVKVNGLEGEFLKRFVTPSMQMARLSTQGAMVRELPSFAMQAIIFGGMLLILMYLIWAHGTFQNALPYIALYALAGYRLMPTLQGAYKNLSEIGFHKATLDTLNRDLSEALDLPGPDHPQPGPSHVQAPLQLKEAIELRHIQFKYKGSAAPTLTDVCLRIRAFTTVAFVGATGSGKTTLIDLILGLLDPSAGEILVDGSAIHAPSVRAWQRAIGYVPQNVFLADDTVLGNIAFGVPSELVDMAAVERAATIAKVEQFVTRELPEGYYTHIGERGVRLSGGQRQRIGIARALYHDPQLLVFDEATSALDNLTEQAVMDAVHQLGRKKTILLVAHRLSTVRHCDEIFLMDQGQIVASGSFDELLVSNENFRRMALMDADDVSLTNEEV